MTLLFLALLSSLLSASFSELYRGDSCTTGTGIPGTCKLIQECPSAQRQLRERRNPTTCGFEGNNPIVCCTGPERTSTSVPEVELVAVIDKSSGANGTSGVTEVKSGDLTEEAQVVRKKPGEEAASRCAQYKERCESSSLDRPIGILRAPMRFRRQDEESLTPDYEDIGTSEKPISSTSEPLLVDEQWITGGERTEENEFPHMVAVGFGKQDEIRWECGGSLISDNFVLTAAHCLIARDGSPAEWVLLGTSHVSDHLRDNSGGRQEQGELRRVTTRVRHPSYRQNLKYNDLALLEFTPSLRADGNPSRTNKIHPACLQVEWDENIRMATATGWGRLGHGENPSSSLQKVQLHILNNTICNETYETEIKLSKLRKGIDESMVCAGDLHGGKDTCQGDSGGPLQQKTDRCLTHIIGVTSFGKVCGFADSPAVYMRVSHFISWIESVVWPETVM